MLSSYSTADEIHNSGVDTVILPVGSTEQHGPHLPIATDYLIAGAVGEKLAEKMGAFLLPTMPVSTCREHMGKRGSVWMSPVTFYNMITDMVLSLKEQGFKKVVLLLAHGGIFIANPTVRDINSTNPDIRVAKIDIGQFLGSPELNSILECKDNLHACEYETSMILYLHEELVRKDRIVDCIPGVPRDYLNYGSILKYSPYGVWGKPSLGTSEKGRKCFEAVTELCARYAKNVFSIKEGYKP